MKKYTSISVAFVSIIALIVFALSCQRDYKSEPAVVPPPTDPVIKGYFVEHFDTNSDLTKKGWVFKNNSDPLGEAGWRTGRYEQINLANKKLAQGIVTVGFPAYRATNDPHDFISCDITACGNQTGTGNFSAWLISPAVPIHNGDSIIFYTIANDLAVDPNNGISTSDRLQLRLSLNSSANVGGDTASVGNFTTVIYDSNPSYSNNSLGGHPTQWTKIAKVISGIPGSGVTTGRFAFRYYASDAGLYGGSAGTNYPSVVGVDELVFKPRN
jgi:hypothetical protein